jgi:hypothetical protein
MLHSQRENVFLSKTEKSIFHRFVLWFYHVQLLAKLAPARKVTGWHDLLGGGSHQRDCAEVSSATRRQTQTTPTYCRDRRLSKRPDQSHLGLTGLSGQTNNNAWLFPDKMLTIGGLRVNAGITQSCFRANRNLSFGLELFRLLLARILRVQLPCYPRRLITP